ncbi:MAG: hypothetical protein N3D12_06345 [Candidatus Methanomethyliaceae archaeon]|nr:hypothetical protein [Candidatus Methanomethyliaceae archaeon]
MEDEYVIHRLQIQKFIGGSLIFHINLDYTRGPIIGLDKAVQFYLGNESGYVYVGKIVEKNSPLNIGECVTASSSYGSINVTRLSNGAGKAGDSSLRYEINVTTNLSDWFSIGNHIWL